MQNSNFRKHDNFLIVNQKHIPIIPKSDRLIQNLRPLCVTACFLSKSINNIDFYALEIFCRVFNFSTLKL